MKSSDIVFKVELDEKNVPEKISWNATDKPTDSLEDTRAIMVALWDHKVLNTMRIDLWTKEMTVDEMKRFYVESLGGMAQSLQSATGDDFMATEINKLADTLAKHVEEEMKNRK